MALRYVIQTYTRRDDTLAPYKRVDAIDLADAVRVARALIPTVAGAAVLAITMEGNQVRTIEVRETVGEMPDGFEVGLLDEAKGANERQ